MDFTIEEVEEIDKEKGMLRFRMVPDKRSWKRAELQGKSGYLNKFDNTFIPDEEMAKAVKTMKGIPIYVSTVKIGSREEYIKKSRKRVGIKNDKRR